jgi:hypothetical protein
MKKQRPLTDEEVCRKFEITREDPAFGMARNLADHRPDCTISDFPEIHCPHCAQYFTYAGPYVPDEWHPEDLVVCPECERHSYVEHVEDGPPFDDIEWENGLVLVYLNTHPLEWFQ